MPYYLYKCLENGRRVEVNHPANVVLKNWGQLCFVGQVEIGETAFEAPIEKIIFSSRIIVPDGNSKLKENGFTKLIKRDQGVYENVTALDGEEKHMIADKPETIPHFRRKIKD